MKDKLIKITDSTVSQLLNSEIILPSNYFQTFDKNAKELNIDLEDAGFEKEINEIIVDEFKKIDRYMKKTVSNIDTLSTAAHDAKEAIKNKDEAGIEKINEVVEGMQKEMMELQKQVYCDALTKLYNRKWINYNFLNEEGGFKKEGFLILIDIKDFKELNSKYGEIIGDNALIFTANFLKQKLEDEGFDFSLARYAGDQFILFVENSTKEKLVSFIRSIRIELSNYILKSKSGLTLKIVFCFGIADYDQRDDFLKRLEIANDLLKEDKFKIDNGKI